VLFLYIIKAYVMKPRHKYSQ